MSDDIDHTSSLLEPTTNLVIDNDKAVENSHTQSNSDAARVVPSSSSSSSSQVPPSSDDSTFVGNTTVGSSINADPHQSKLQTSLGQGNSVKSQSLQVQSKDTEAPALATATIDEDHATGLFQESLSTSPITPTTQSANADPRESFKSHSATSSTSTLTPEDQERIYTKEKNLDEIKQQCSCLIHELEGNDQPEVIIKRHIQQLKKYNELKDVALQLVTLIADQRQVKTTDILNEMKLEVGEDGNQT